MNSSPLFSILASREFLFGVASTTLVLAVKAMIGLFQYPSLESIAKKANRPFDMVVGDTSKDGDIILFGFEKPGDHPGYSAGISDDSYYVSRVEANLRLAKIPYTKLASQGGSENPRGKVPFCNVKGQMVDDSARILETIKNMYMTQEGNSGGKFVNPDANLSPEQHATGHMVRQLLEGSLYWVSCHFAFHTEQGRKNFKMQLASHGIPPGILDAIVAMAFRNMHANMHGQGIARMPEADIIKKGQADLKALSVLLGDKPYMLTTKQPSTLDADCFAMLVMLFNEPLVFSKLAWFQESKSAYPNLVQYVERMRLHLYPELNE